MVRRQTHELLWLAVKAALVIVWCVLSRSALEWVAGSVFLVFVVTCFENESRKRFTKSVLEETVDDRLWSEERKRQERLREQG